MGKKEKKISLAIFIFFITFFIKDNSNMKIFLLLISYIIAAKEILLKAINNIRKKDLFDENFLMSLATIGAIIIQDYAEATAVMLFYQVGEILQSYAVGKSRKSITELMDIKAEYANLLKNNKFEKVEPEEICVGDIIEIRTGEKVPVDAEIISGKMLLDTSSLTGESLPISVKEGDKILSACINLEGIARAKVLKEYYDSSVNKILELVENASNKKAKSERIITRFSKIYTPIVVFLAILLAILPPIITKTYDFKEWIFRSLSFLVVSCPCAFVISVPMTFFSGIGLLSKNGILVKGGNYLELLANLKIIVFDKTGTLTKGKFSVQKIKIFNNEINEKDFIKYVALAESSSNHPISKSIQNYYNEKIDISLIEKFSEISGKGIEAIIEGKNIKIGNEKLINLPNDLILDEIGSILYVSVDDIFTGYLVISDEIKENVKESLKNLKILGLEKIIMLTGDIEKTARKVAELLDFNAFFSNLLPNEKVQKIEEIMEENSTKKIAFVGDGINDAPVLSRVDIGIAMGGMGSDSAIEAADVVIMNDEISKIALAIKIARKTMRIAIQNIFLALFIKILALILSALGITNMWMAVFADVGVTIIAVLNSLRALKLSK